LEVARHKSNIHLRGVEYLVGGERLAGNSSQNENHNRAEEDLLETGEIEEYRSLDGQKHVQSAILSQSQFRVQTVAIEGTEEITEA